MRGSIVQRRHWKTDRRYPAVYDPYRNVERFRFWARHAAFSVAALAMFLPGTAPAEEMRAAWVASVYNLNFPSRPGLGVAAQEAEIQRIVQTAADRGLNALMVQVRPEGDALYASRLEPWSRFLTGKQGADPGYDPLEIFLAEGRKRGIAIHAWINPFRAATGTGNRTTTHFSRVMPESVRKVGKILWFDPGVPAVQAHILAVVEDLVRRYPVAGVVLDDYFYPYPDSGLPRGTFPDGASYAAYRRGGGTLAVTDWRRDNVNRLVADMHRAVASVRGGTKFGVSPFGIYRPGTPAGTRAGVDEYADLYCDPLEWMRQGWVDYLSPQLYWREGGPQSYSALLNWWRSPAANPRGAPIVPSVAIDRLGAGYGWPAAEIANQLRLEKTIGPRPGGGGFILWSMGPLLRDQKGIGGVVAASARQ